MSEAPPSSATTKRLTLQVLLADGQQTTKVVVDPSKLGKGEQHGFPGDVLDRYRSGIPLDLNPAWPLDLDFETDPAALLVSLSFGGLACRCRVPWAAVSMIGVGVPFLNISWEHERAVPPSPEPGPGAGNGKRGGHLKVVK